MFKQKRLTVLSMAVVLALLGAAVMPFTALADDVSPPPTEVPVVDVPPTEVPVVDAAPTEEPVVDVAPTEAPVVDVPPTESVSDVVAALADANAVLLDADGDPIPLASQEAADALTYSDPWFDAGGGVIVGYSLTGTCVTGVTECNTSTTPIQDAIDDARSGGTTINVEAGTYTEQIVIAKSLTLAGSGAATTTIQAPATLATDVNGYRSIVTITGSGVTVDFSGFTVNGPTPSGFNNIFGIFVGGGATANIHDNTIADVRDNPFSGAQHGVAIQVGRSSSVGTATIDNNTIEDYQKNGITVNGTGSSAIITDNTVTGAGPTTTIAQNGIQISGGATGTISGNTVTGNYWTLNDDWTSTGILLYEAGEGVVVEGNTVDNNQVNVYAYASDNVTIKKNTISNATEWDGIDLYDVNGASVEGNILSGSSYDGIWIGGTTSNISITNNKFLNNGNGSSAAGDPAAGGIHVTDGDLGTMTIAGNLFDGNQVGVSNDTGSGILDASGNWWGCATGPGTAGCDTVSSNVTFNPFLTTDPFVAPPAGGGDGGDGGGGTTPILPPLAPAIIAETAPVTLEDLPGALPEDKTFVAGISVITVGSGQVSFDIPADAVPPFTILFWDGTQWVEIPFTVVDGQVVFTVTQLGVYVLVAG